MTPPGMAPPGMMMAPPGMMMAAPGVPPQGMAQRMAGAAATAPMGAMPGMPMVAPHVTQMLADAAKGGRSSNVFFKTRICNR